MFSDEPAVKAFTSTATTQLKCHHLRDKYRKIIAMGVSLMARVYGKTIGIQINNLPRIHLRRLSEHGQCV